MKFLLGMLAAALLTGVLSAPPAEARCWVNRHGGWQCLHSVQHHQAHRFPAPSLGE